MNQKEACEECMELDESCFFSEIGYYLPEITSYSLSMNRFLRSKKESLAGFTLVELIVVITILVILGTIAFISLQGYVGSARDSVRIENLANLEKGLRILKITSGSYPMPEVSVNIVASGSLVGYQGFAKNQTAALARLSQ